MHIQIDFLSEFPYIWSLITHTELIVYAVIILLEGIAFQKIIVYNTINLTAIYVTKTGWSILYLLYIHSFISLFIDLTHILFIYSFSFIST